MRSFIALSISELLEKQLSLHAHSLSQQLPNEDLRWIPAENYHITLAFLGDISPQTTGQLESIISKVAGQCQPCELQINNVVWFPSIHKPRLIVATLAENEALKKLQAKLCTTLRQAGFSVEGKRFRPHISLARAGRRQQPKKFQLVLDNLHTDMDEMVLFESQLTPTGSRYTPLYAALLGA